MDKQKKAPLPEQTPKRKAPVFVRGTVVPEKKT
jgi:hypothetical protein